ncbi:MAG: DUF4433 domain-containing protein [Bacteroides sp.]|nr:DUF4433 domain-containing protein [Bacteroides sp.]
MDSIDFFNSLLMQINGFEEFLLTHQDIKDFNRLINTFREKMMESNSLDYNSELILKIVQEKYGALIMASCNGMSYLNSCMQINDSNILSEFSKDCKDIYSSDFEFKNSDNQHYRTIAEQIAYRKVNFTSEIIDKYIDCFHPYICSKIALPFLNAKMYDIGLTFLQKSLYQVFSYPNIYWDNPLAIYGCTDALFEFQHLLGRQGMLVLGDTIGGGLISILKILYLYLSRSIHILDCKLQDSIKGFNNSDTIPEFVLQKINYLSLRADLAHDYRQEFNSIFGIGINPDIQYIADKATSYKLSQQFGISLITEQCWCDALKMYRYGSLVPNNTGGYQEIEDATFGELIDRGISRSERIAKDLLREYHDGQFAISKPKIVDAILFLKDKLTQSFEYAIYRREHGLSISKLQTDYWSKHIICSQKTNVDIFKNLIKCNKTEYYQIKQYLIKNHVNCFYHFTDRRNLNSIKKYGCLFSWKYCKEQSIQIEKQGGDYLSQERDLKMGLDDYVRLSFCSDHPMIWRLKCNGYDLVLLKIKIDVAWSEKTLFSNMNSTDEQNSHGGTFKFLQMVDIDATKQHYLSRQSPNFKKHQAEVMVKTAIPIDYIINIDNPISI